MLTKHGQGNGGVEKQKSKQTQKLTPEIFESRREDFECMKLTSNLYKNEFPPPSGFFLLVACCYVAMLIAIDYEIVYNGTRGGFGHLELVEVDESCLA